MAAASVALKLPHPGIIATLIGFFALLYATAKLRNSGWGLAAVFGLTGFIGYTLGPIVGHSPAMPNKHQVVVMAMGGFVLAGVIVAFMAGLGPLDLVFFDLFKGLLALFLLEMGPGREQTVRRSAA